ncbi:Hint domain-containing protein [Acidisoma silvae]|uniref:Hint domain-containing protein n=1 Tax=Acidisoma silvae TaxID=2802396 RepID=A0A963YT17_9PROT|nr:Hint domain-containing protein [Acidisoma silvae]MCB8875828.1 Hint domain-containing protein [Acidisoma silvae]
MSYSNANGVTYAVGLPYFPPLSLVTFTNVTITGSWEDNVYPIPTTNVITTSENISGLLAALSTFAIVPTVVDTVTFTIGLANTFHVGGELDFSSVVGALGNVFDIDGGDVKNSGLVTALGTVTANIGNGGTFDVGATGLSLLTGVSVNFENTGGTTTGGTFIVNGSGGGIAILTAQSITGFVNASDKIEFEGLTTPVTSYTVSASVLGQQTVTLYGGGADGTGEIASFTVGTLAAPSTLHVGTTSINPGSGNPDTGSLVFSANAGGITVGADVTGDSILCFLDGTMIRTLDGEQAIETFEIGDLVVTSSGKVEEIRWIGISTNSAKGRDPLNVLPIRIRAGALGDNLPLRDLLVSPDHALLIDGVLVQAGALVNDLSITREYDVPETFTYYHIELSSHELILAEGVPAETFVDNVSRMAFDNWAEHEALYGDAPIEEMDLPRAQSARQVKPLTQHRLMARAEALFGVPMKIAA